MRLIDADALMEVINCHCYPVQHDMTSIEPGMTRIGILQAIQEQPTVELERKKGKWIKAIDENGEAWSCSECTTEYIVDEMDEFPKWANFCPNCGADMRGAKK